METQRQSTVVHALCQSLAYLEHEAAKEGLPQAAKTIAKARITINCAHNKHTGISKKGSARRPPSKAG